MRKLYELCVRKITLNIAINQIWAGHPGLRIAADAGSTSPAVPAGAQWQVWAKPLAQRSHAVLFVSTGPEASAVLTVPFAAISSVDFAHGAAACVYDMYDASARPLGPLSTRGANLTSPALGAHASAFYCVSSVDATAKCEKPANRGACPM